MRPLYDPPTFYVLREHEVVPAVEYGEWGKWFETAWPARCVKQETLPSGLFVSTVFLGIDHRFVGEGPPLLFETMAFEKEGGGALDDIQERCSTWAQAEAQHARVVAQLLAEGR